MQKFLRTFALAAAMMLPFAMQAQLSAVYDLSTGVDNSKWYTLTSDSVVLIDASSFTTSTSATTGDSKKTDVTNIGFTFNFAGVDYTQFSANSDGTVRLGATQIGTSGYASPFSTSNASVNAPKICGLGCDGCMVLGDYIAYQLFGTEGDHVLVIEISTGSYNSTTRANHYTFQVQLAEADNSVTVVYSPTAPAAGPNASYQLGASAGANDIVLYDVTNHTLSTHTAGVSTSNAAGTWPEAGRYYTMTPNPNACFPVTDLAIDATQTTVSSLTLTWADTSNSAASHEVYSITATDTISLGTATTTSYTVSGLEANTAYEFGVVANCGSGNLANMATVSGRTACAAIATLPYTMGFEDADLQGTTSALLFPFCWTRINTLASGTYTYYPYAYSSTSAHNGGRHLYFYASSYGTYADTTGFVMPELDVTTYPMNANRVSFWGKVTGSTDYTVLVGTMSDPADRSTFTLVESVTVTGTTYTKYTVSLANATATDAYVAFIVPKVAATMYIDDVTLEEMPSCLEVPTVAVDAVTSSSITLSWTENPGNASATYSVYNMADTSLVASDINGTTYTVENLDANTPYVFAVQANCPAGDAPYTLVNGRTNCAAEALPFTESFSATLSSDPCWRGASILYTDGVNVTMGAASNWIYCSSESNGLEAGHYRVNIYGTSCYKWMITPEIDLTTASNPLLTFDAAFTVYTSTSTGPATGFESNDSQKFMVLVSTNNGQTWSVASDIALTSIASATYITQYVNLAAYAGETVRIAFYAQSTVSGGDNNLHIDNIAIDESTGEICYPVSGLAASNITAAGATLTWEGSADSYNVYTIAGDDTTLVDNVSDTALVIDTLTANTSYTFGVTSVCGSDESGMVSVTFRTNCGAEALPFTESFSATLSSDPCWRGASILYTDGVNVTMGNNSNWTYSSSESNGLEAGHYRVNIYGTSCYKWMITPEIDLTEATNPLLTFDAAFTAYSGTAVASGFESNTSQKFMILVSINNGQTWSVASDIALSTIASLTYIPQYVNLASYAGETVRIAFYAQSTTSGGDNNLHIDNINVDESTGDICYPVSGLTASNVTADSATLTWTGTADSYNVYTIVGDDTTLVDNVTDMFIELGNLTAMTSYTYGVASVCGSDESEMRSVNFTTACATAVMPFTQNFNNLTSGIPMCWDNSEGTTTTADYRWNYYATGHDGAGLRFNCYYNSNGNTNVLATPAITIDEAAQLSFWYKNPTGGDFTVMVGIAGSETRTTLATGLTGVSDWTLATYVLPDSLVDEDVVVYFKGTSNYGNGDAYIYLDDVTIEAVPDCMPVSDLAATNVTADSATLTWTGTADSYNVYTIVGDNATLVDNVTDTFMVIDELTAMTSYTYGVASVCGSDESEMRSVSFRTACSSIAIPFTEDFENGIDCWTMVDCASGTNVVANDSYTTYAYSGTHAFKFAYNTNPPQYLISPELTGGEDGVQVSLMYKVGGSYTESFVLGYSTTTNETSAFTWLTEQTGLTNQTYEAYTGYLPAGTKYVAVKYTANDQLSLYIDSLVFSPISADFCFPVAGLAVDTATANSVTISWTGDAASYSIYNGTAYVGSTADTFYTFNGLTASTAYTFGVTAVCSATDSADMVTISAMTDCEGGSCTITIATGEYGLMGASIDVMQNGVIMATVTESNYDYYTENVTVCSGVPVTLVYNSGYYDDYVEFTVTDGNDSTVYTTSDASDLSDGAVFLTLNNACGSVTPQPQVEEATIDASAVTYWVGTGNNQVVMAVNWADTALAWGVNFSTDSITSQAALDTIAANDPRFSWTTGSYGLGNITFTENGTTLTGDANHFWESKRNTISDMGLSQNLGNGDFQKWANSAAGVVVDSMEYSGVWYYMYNYPMTIYPVTAPQPGPQPADSIVVTFATNDATLGTTTPAPGTYTYHAGDTIRFSANATTGNSFVEWVIDYGNGTADTVGAEYATGYYFLASTLMGYGITNMTFNATFQAGVTAPDSISVTYTVNDAVMGTITPNGTIRQAVGSTISATATANDGYRIHGWRLTIMAGGQVANDTTFVTATTSASFGTIPQYFVSYGASVIVTAIFEPGAPDSVAVTYTVNDATMGSITPNGTVMTAVGDSIAATATANAGYELYGWRFTVYVNGAVASDTTIAIVETSVNFGAVPQFYADANATITITAMFQQQVGIEDADISNVNVYSANSTIYVRGAEGQSVYVFDVNGRMLNHEAKASESCSFRMENTGVYLVKVGNAAAQRVIVVR